MSDESQSGNLPPNYLETHRIPPQVDFRQIAQQAITNGIFIPDEEAIRLNAANPNLAQSFPISMLDVPYNNGPMFIQRFEEDVPEVVMNKFRKNWVAANRLLLPNDQVLGYFHQRFIAQDVFKSGQMNKLVNEYSPASLTGHFSRGVSKDPSLSFKVKDVDRATRNRELFTQSEQQAGIELTAHHPEVALTILGYQSVVLDYLQNLGNEFRRLTRVPNSGVTSKNVENMKRFTEQWDTSNFTKELVPAIALYYTIAKQANAELPDDQILTQKLYQDAVDFIVANGAFRNFVTVPAHVASEGRARVNHFLCPAVGTIREQLLDGSLLYRIYGITRKQFVAGNRDLSQQADAIRAKSTKALQEPRQIALMRQQEALENAAPTVELVTDKKTLPQVIGDAIVKVLEKKKPATFSFGGKSYRIPNENLTNTLGLEQRQEQGDIMIEPHGGDDLYILLQKAIVTSLAARRPVYFSFNGRDFRINPEKVEALLDKSTS